MSTLDPNLPPNDQLDQNLVLSQNVANRIIEHSNDSILISLAQPIDQPGPRVVYANETFSKQTGYSQEDIIGNNPRILHGPDTDQATLARIRKGLIAWQPIREEVLNYKKMVKRFGKSSISFRYRMQLASLRIGYRFNATLLKENLPNNRFMIWPFWTR